MTDWKFSYENDGCRSNLCIQLYRWWPWDKFRHVKGKNDATALLSNLKRRVGTCEVLNHNEVINH